MLDIPFREIEFYSVTPAGGKLMIPIEDIAYLRVAVDDLDEQERFLLDFGMERVGRTDRALYMRGAGTQPVIHISELRSDDYRPAVGLIPASPADLDSCARAFDVPVEENTEPGGGKIVRVTDPAGFRVEIVHRPPAEPLSVRPIVPGNFGPDRSGYGRLNAKQRFGSGPSHVLRLGHAVMFVPDAHETFEWYTRNFNFQISDSYFLPGDESRSVVILARCGLGKRFTDHHTLAFMDLKAFPNLSRAFDHSAYEVLDWDDLMVGHDFLADAGRTHSYGVGRHVEGGMVFDYWRDSAGNKIEHWVDGDYVNEDYEPAHVLLGSGNKGRSWGPEPTAPFLA
jgi:catechol 2,3-dioxygenase-like lactoylglutathione lyase family enzyme